MTKRQDKTKPKLSDETAQALPEIQIPDFQFSTNPAWTVCPECREHVFTDCFGHSFYHRINCSKSNGIRYRMDRL